MVDRLKRNKTHREREKKFYDIEKRNLIGDYIKNTKSKPAITNDNFLEAISWVSMRTQTLMDLPCAYCGTFEEVHQHHLRHVRKRAYSLIDENTP
jgi:hypothetical protein